MKKSRHIFVTGGGRGIGEAVAIKFAQTGNFVTVSDLDPERAQAVTDSINMKINVNSANSVIGNVSLRKDVIRMFEEATKIAGPVEVLVNCAGIYPSNPITEITDEEWDKVMNINLRGTFLCSQIAVKGMIQQKKGWIINMASVDGLSPGPNNCVYSASKAGVVSITRSFASEFTALGIRINAVAPGWVGTPNIYKNDRWKEAVKKIPIGRLAEPSEIAEVISFLCSDQGYYIAGEVINVNGGMFMN